MFVNQSFSIPEFLSTFFDQSVERRLRTTLNKKPEDALSDKNGKRL